MLKFFFKSFFHFVLYFHVKQLFTTCTKKNNQRMSAAFVLQLDQKIKVQINKGKSSPNNSANGGGFSTIAAKRFRTDSFQKLNMRFKLACFQSTCQDFCNVPCASLMLNQRNLAFQAGSYRPLCFSSGSRSSSK